MKLKAVILKNFRAYRDETRIDIGSLTAFVGRNDVGKSTIFEALEIFFNGSLVKIENLDACVSGDKKEVRVGCVFIDFPEEIILDKEAMTSLRQEHLLNEEGLLEIHKVFDCTAKSPKESVFAVAMHPTADNVSDLLEMNISSLKNRLAELRISKEGVDLRSKPAIRKAIWESVPNLSPARCEIRLNKGEEDVTAIWDRIQGELPLFALFQVDRTSKDDDPEVQNPMKLAVAEAIKEAQETLDQIKETIREKATKVADRTLEKLREMDPSLAQELSPHFKSEPAWNKLFTLTLTGEGDIPIDKRGSGTRRLILLNFFRAEAERKGSERGSPGVIYAIEEPETSQHPHNQKLIVQALYALAQRENCQVLMSTHVPGLAGLLPTESLRLVSMGKDGSAIVEAADDDVYRQIADELGVMPENQVQAFACVEGPHDVEAVKHVSRILHRVDPEIPDLSSEARVILFFLSGSTLQYWVANHYLEDFKRPEIHLYDRGTQEPPQYQHQVNEINGRNDRSYACLTTKREMENYLHPEAIKDALDVDVAFGDEDSVPEVVARAFHEKSDSQKAWAELDEKTRGRKISNAKRRLNTEAFARMTGPMLQERDPNGDLERWLREVGNRLS